MIGSASRPVAAGRNLVLVMLALIYAVNFLDRQITSVLAAPIKAEFHLSDTALGWLGGPTFAILYAVFGVPVAWLADRFSRTWIITGALALWSGFTALGGLAVSAPMLFAARIGVGVGEAGGVAPSYSLIADYFPEKLRGRAMAVYALGVPVGGAAGVLLGGVLGQAMGWRAAFLAVGLAGVLLAPVFRLLVREPVRDRGGDAAGVAAPTLARTVAAIAPVLSFWGIAVAAAVASIAGYGAAFWLPSFLARVHHLALAQVGVLYSAVFLVGGLIGLPLAGWLADRLGSRRKSAYAFTPAACFLLAIPVYAIGLTTPSLPLAIAMFTIGQALGLSWLGPLPAAVQQLVPPRMRATASAVFLFVVAIIGQCVGPPVMGALSDHLKATLGEGALGAALMCVPAIYAAAAAILALTAGRLAKDWRAV